MLDFLRRGVKSWVAKILLALLILSFAVWGIGDIFISGQNATVARAGETEVGSERFVREIVRQQNLLSRQQGALISLQDMQAAGVGRQLATAMAREAAFTEELGALGLAVPAAAVRDAILANPSFQDGSGNFSQYAYQSAIGQRQYDPREFETLMAHELGQQILQDAVANGIRSTPGIAQAIAAFDGEERDVASIRIQAADAADPGQPDEGTLLAWFTENQQQFREPERRWGAYIHTDLAALTDAQAPTDEEVRAEYDQNPDAYTVPATRTVDQIVFDDVAAAQDAAKRVAEGSATFEEIAVEQNVPLEDLALGTVSEGELSDAASEAVFALQEPGVAGPVEGPFGHILLNVTALEIGGLQPFELIAPGIRASLTQSRALQAAIDAGNSIDDARASGAAMEEIAEQTGLKLVRFQGLSQIGDVKEGDLPSLAADPQFLREVFEATDGEERDLVQLSDGSYLLVLVERIADSYLPELDEVRTGAIAAWQHEERLKAQEARARSLVESGATLQRISSLSFSGITEHGFAARSASPGFLSEDLVQSIFAGAEGDILVGRSRDGQSVVLAEVRAIKPLAEDAMAEQSTAIEDALSGSISRDQMEYFARALEARHGAMVDLEAVDGVFEYVGSTGQGYGG